ncbi:MAG: hypothetical protein IPI67_00390 [Myxococcales bacterium]|nr:hypothetical protein [Myxococcales bacterium]
MRISKLNVGAAVVLATVSFAGSALAQDAEASGEVGMTLPGATGPKAGAATGESDHDQMIGHFAIGYLGARAVPIMDIAGGAGNPTPVLGTVQAPVIGLRYWLDQGMGLDVGLGFFSSGGSTKNGNTTTDKAGINAVLVHAGVPLALSGSKHFSFQIVPEANVGFAQQTKKDIFAGNDELKNSGFVIDVGARAGAELHFGFIGVPQLSLQGSVGVLFRSETRTAEYTPPAGASTTVEDKSTVISTSVYDNPWNIFTSNVAALYYF